MDFTNDPVKMSLGPISGGGKLTNSDQTPSAPEQDWWLQARYLVAFACFMANAVSFLMRVNLSVAIVAMTLNNEGEGHHVKNNHSSPVYNWDSRTRGMVLSSFTWGYIVTQLPLGALAEQAGPRRPLFVCLVVSSAATFLFETAAAYGWHWACASRVVLGLAQGGLLPCCHAMLSRWSVPSERGRMTTYAYTGQQFGMIVGLSGSGILTAWAGWKYVFYTSGALGLVVAGLWFSLVTDSPDTHILASARERSHIQTSILAANGETKGGTHLPTPYKSIVTSKHVWAIVIAHCAFMWSQWTLLTNVPSFLNGVAKFNISQEGLLSALPFLVMWIVGLVLSAVSDWMLKRNCCSITTSRKLGNSLAQYGSALGLIALGFFSEDPYAAVAILTTTVGISAAVYIGFMVNYIDLSPNFAGTMIGLGNSISYTVCIAAPLLVGDIVTDTSNEEQWRIVFFIAAAFYLVGNTVFVLLGTAKVQPWNNEQDQSETKSETSQESSTSTSTD